MKGFLKGLLGQDKQNEAIIVVSGLPRSGTSMLMKMLDAGGVPPLTDNIRTADEDNPKGYYEFERVKALDKGDTAWVADAHGKSVKVISALLKHLPADQSYRVVYVRRNMDEILASQRKMLVRRGEDPDKIDDAQQIIQTAFSLSEPGKAGVAKGLQSHYFVVLDRFVEPSDEELEENRSMIEGALLFQREQAVFKGYVQALKAEMADRIEVNEKLL